MMDGAARFATTDLPREMMNAVHLPIIRKSATWHCEWVLGR